MKQNRKQNRKLWYRQSATCLNEALPIGNGKMAAMVFGGGWEETIWMDDATFWSGEPSRENNRRDTPELIERLRKLLLAHHYAEADRLGKEFVGVKHNYGTHMPLGLLKLCHADRAASDSGAAACPKAACPKAMCPKAMCLKDSDEKGHREAGREKVERSLDLFTGVAATSFNDGESNWRRECFMSYPGEVFSLRYGAAEKTPFTLEIRWEGIENDVRVTGMAEGDILLEGNAYETLHSDGRTGVSLRGRIRILTDGTVVPTTAGATVRKATELVLLMASETTMTAADPDFVCRQRLDRGEKTGYRQLRAEHTADIGERMGRVGFVLGADADGSYGEGKSGDTYSGGMSKVDQGPAADGSVAESAWEGLPIDERAVTFTSALSESEGLPTDERIEAFRNGAADPGLMVLAFQYGRYVTLASSREASPLPTHMGGIWNDNIYNKQDSTQDMHIDMNLQMQYWPAFPCNLAECFPPVTKWMRDTLVPAGQEAARVAYGAGGWTAHVTSNPWGYAALGWAYNWGSFTFGGAWCATLLWDYFEYTWDLDYLRAQAYPILLGAAEFMLDYLFYDADNGYFMTGPSYSPENHYLVGGEQYTLSLSTTCDVLMIREIFTMVLRAAKLLGLPSDTVLTEIAARLRKLPPYRVGKHGQIQEWYYDFEEPIPNHRHPSHLLGLYPFAQITPEEAPALAKAARTSIGRRLVGFEKTSWGYNIFAGMYARLYDGEAAKAMLEENLRKLAVANLTVVMPAEVAMWAGTWELDGNTGISAAISEMIAQSRAVLAGTGPSEEIPGQMQSDERYEIRLLPALPTDWPNGKLTGLCLRGGLKLDISWKDGQLLAATLLSVRDIRITVWWGENSFSGEAKAAKAINIPTS